MTYDDVMWWFALGGIGSALWFCSFQQYSLTPKDKWENMAAASVFIPLGPLAIMSFIMLLVG